MIKLFQTILIGVENDDGSKKITIERHASKKVAYFYQELGLK